MRKGKAKTQPVGIKVPISKKSKDDTIHPVAKGKCERPPKKSRLVMSTIGSPL